MNLTNKSVLKELLKNHNARPDKYLGQHFILSKKALDIMIGAAEIKSTDTVVEIGPGLGTLTRELAGTGAKIIAVEKDPLMVEILKETVASYKNIKVIEADANQLSILRIDSFGDKMGTKIERNKYKIVANLPYNVATFLIHQWLESENAPDLMVLMIQKEVAQRMAAKPPHSNLLAISVQFYADAKVVDYVPAGAFWPRPKVDAAIIKLTLKNDHYKPIGSKQSIQFFRVIKAGFSSPRKQLAGNLSKKLGIPKEKIISIFKSLNIPEQARAENLGLNEWGNLVRWVIHN